MGLRLVVVDAFTDRPFAGNPAAVAVVDDFPADQVMQTVAREMNLAETAFLTRRPDGDLDLRWFTPDVEVDLCGHATLASAHVLGGPARFHTRSGVLACAAGEGGIIEMDFPADPPAQVADLPDLDVGRVRWAGRGRFDMLVELDDASAVRGLQPNLAAIAALDTRAVIVTAPGDQPGIDCVSRVFAPNVGIAEDPVTGSAHCTLAEFWGERTGRTSLVGEQASARGGKVLMRREGERVILGGWAVTVSEVHLLVDLGP
jgi:predicted PhzF superfamily epimerase YddE/YHI9